MTTRRGPLPVAGRGAALSLSSGLRLMTSAQFTAVASVIISIALIALVVILVPIAWQLRRSYKKFNRVLERVLDQSAPLIQHATTAAQNVEYITTVIRGDIQRVNATLTEANERVKHAVALTENRLTEFSSLLSVVQDEAEQLFVSTASTVRGVKHGASSLSVRGGMDLASDAVDDIDDPDLADGESQENDHGDPSDSDGPAEAPPAPRVRPRTATRRRAGGGI